ncbi:hypothetical protein ASZ90_005381 [hydrocarbon metagenome]|uniref:Batd n=1 Tax=hydrocarbon metagenome TaxID=938273 RepID=A0A0W8FV90_9ZZZZ
MVSKIVKYFLVILFLSLQLFAQDFRVLTEIDSAKYLIGDYINIKYRIEYKDGIGYQMPSIKDSVHELSFIKELPLQQYKKDDYYIDEHTFVFSKYDSAGVVVPSVKFKYTDSNKDDKISYSNQVEFVVTTMEVNLQEDIQDVKAPIRIPLNWWMILLYVLILILLATLIYFIYRRYLKKKETLIEAKPIIKIPPHEIALKALRSLEEQKLWQQGRVKEYHTELTDIIRRYFEGRFNFLAMEMPSSEVIDNLTKISNGKLFEKVESFFNNADLVKFAKFQPLPSINEKMMIQAYDIVKSTKETVANESEEVKTDV